nr:uncharacterized protein LOC111518225 [Leptinotarsa decemlineata]
MAANLNAVRCPRSERTSVPYFTWIEISIFKELLQKYSSDIECKKTDEVSNYKKLDAWIDLCREFNLRSSYHRRYIFHLKGLWENLKKDAPNSTDRQCIDNESRPQHSSDHTPETDPEAQATFKEGTECLQLEEKNRTGKIASPTMEVVLRRQLKIANLNLIRATHQELQKEAVRKGILFELDRKRKELEIEIMKLDILKRKKELDSSEKGNSSKSC